MVAWAAASVAASPSGSLRSPEGEANCKPTSTSHDNYPDTGGERGEHRHFQEGDGRQFADHYHA
jgi:hypothetical protein